ncbi:SGNH/GDSL hydrolase family protein [Nocardia sp. NPDC051052]|uniref:SGNH/GDSL hydrolase family protein n=1 Tax=Nocardia sp. NPDC051052 TaxID=3364322 RepID=UPI0037A0411F
MNFSRIRLGVVAALAASGIVAVSAPMPTAAADGPGVRYISFGDSQTAAVYAGGGGPLGLPELQQQPKTVPPPNPVACGRTNYGWPSTLAGEWGLGAPQLGDWADYACQSATTDIEPVNNLRTQVDQSIKDGMLGPATKLVTIQIGGNDTWYPGQQSSFVYTLVLCMVDILRGCDDRVDPNLYLDANAVTGASLAQRLTAGLRGDIIGAIRAAAPNVAIKLVGYPDPLPPVGVPFVCTHVVGIPVPWPQARSAYAHKLSDAVESAQRDAAEQLGLGFWSLRPPTAGHDACAADSYWTGVADPGQSFFPFHQTLQGHAVEGTYLNGARIAEGIG